MLFKNLSVVDEVVYETFGANTEDLSFLDCLFGDLGKEAAQLKESLNVAGNNESLIPALETIKHWDKNGRQENLVSLCNGIKLLATACGKARRMERKLRGGLIIS